MKLPVDIIWRFIGDFYSSVITEDRRRAIEAAWQGQFELTADAVAYLDYYRKSKNIFEVDPYAPYGNFPDQPELVDIQSRIDGTIIGARGTTWLVYSESDQIPKTGFFRIFDSTIEYFSFTSRELQSGGHILYLETLTDGEFWENFNNPSHVFADDRFGSVGSRNTELTDDGLYFNVEWVNHLAAFDSYWMSGSEDWEQTWSFRITKWDPTVITRTLSLNIYSDSGPAYEVRLYNNKGAEVKVGFGAFADARCVTLNFSGSSVSRTRGNFIDDGFRAGYVVEVAGTDLNDGTYTIASVSGSTITFSDASFTTETSSSGIIKNRLEDSTGDTSAWRSLLQTATETEPVYVDMQIRYDAASSSMYSTVWVNNEAAIQEVPYQLSPGRKLVAVDAFNQINDFQLYADFFRGTGSTTASTEILDFSTDVGDSFSYVYQVNADLIDSGTIRSEPWDLTPTGRVESQSSANILISLDEGFARYAPAVARIEDGSGSYIVATLSSISDDDVANYTINRKSNVLDNFSRSYVDIHPWYDPEISWVSKTLFSLKNPIPDAIETAWFEDAKGVELDMYGRYGKLLGLPNREDSPEYLATLRAFQYAKYNPPTKQNMETAISVIVGLPYSQKAGFIQSIEEGDKVDTVVLNNHSVQVDSFWRNNGLLKPVGSSIPFMGSLVTPSPIVHDWKTNPELIRDLAGYWAQWGTFTVQFPSTVGVDPRKVRDIQLMLDSVKSKHTTYILESVSSEQESLFFGRQTDERTVQRPRAIEDLTFDDHGAVVGQPLDYQTIDGQLYSEEYQTDPDPETLGNSEQLDWGDSLDVLRRPNPRVIDGELDFRYSSLYLKEESALFDKKPLRVNDYSTTYPQGHKPRELLWLYEGVTDTSVTYNDGEWRQFDSTDTSNQGNITDFWFETNKFIYASTAHGYIYRSNSGGKDWVKTSLTSSLGSVENGRAVGGIAELWSWNGTSWISSSPASWAATAMRYITFATSDIGWAFGNNGGDTYIFQTTDGGDTWGAGIMIDSGDFRDASFVDTQNGYVTNSSGIYRTTDGGGTWNQIDSSSDWGAVQMITEDIVIGTRLTNIYRSTNAQDVTPSFVSVHSIADNYLSMTADASKAYAVSGTTISSSIDGGANWIDEETGLGGLLVVEMNNKVRLVGGQSDTTWRKT